MLPRRDTSYAASCRAGEGVAEGCRAQSCTQKSLLRATQSRYITLCLMRKQKKLSRNGTSSAHINTPTCTQEKEGLLPASLLLLTVLLVTTQIKLPSWQGLQTSQRFCGRTDALPGNTSRTRPSGCRRFFPTQTLELQFLPPQKRLLPWQPDSWLGVASRHTQRTGLNATNTSAGLASQKGSSQHNQPIGFKLCNQNLRSPKITRHFKKWGFDVKRVICYKIKSIKLYRN